jgi:hypothetical protein
MIERITAILHSCENNTAVLPLTILFNESWLLRLVLDWFSHNKIVNHPLNFEYESIWYSEGLLRSPFLPRVQGDPLSESWTHADGIIGNISIEHAKTSEIKLLPAIKHFVVLEAKIYSKFSQGVKHASYFDQAARTVACMAKMIEERKIDPIEIDKIGFYVLAPASQIKDGIFSKELNRTSLHNKIERRVNDYGKDKPKGLELWFNQWFESTFNRMDISSLSWEEILEVIINNDPKTGLEMQKFYNRCLEYNRKIG